MWLRPELEFRRAVTGMVLAIGLFLSWPVHADSGLLSDDLGRWLDTEAIPELAEVLSEHPRFKGETIKVVSLQGGRPTHRTSRLHEAVQAHLTQRLLSRSGVRIAWSDRPLGACGVQNEAVYLLGVEIERDGSRYHRLNIGMIDVAESVWVSGVNHTWRGRLTATESAALGQAVTSVPRGTVENPLPVTASSEIAQAMLRHLKCALPDGLDGPVYLERSESPALDRIAASLNLELTTTPVAAITRDAGDASWILAITEHGSPAGLGVTEVGLQLSDPDGKTSQRLATLYVSGSPGRPLPADTRIAAAPPAAVPPPSPHPLLSPMSVETSSEGICKGRRGGCAEVSFELNAPAYLFVLSSRDRELSALSCEARLVEATAGERRYRVKVWPGKSRLPDAGLYAIAVTDRTAANAVARHIRTGVCSRPLARSSGWLNELDELLASHPGAVQWRAVHMVQTANGVAEL